MACYRNNLKAGRSNIKGTGLFTEKYLPIGSFIGFYSGKELEETDQEAKKNGSYAMQVTPGVIFDADPKTNEKDLLGYVNEPPKGETANVNIVPYELHAKHHSKDGPMAVAIAFYAATDIKKGTELLVHYGPGYERKRNQLGYEVGKAGPPISVKKLENPLKYMSFLPLDCFVAVEQQHSAPKASRPPVSNVDQDNRRPRGRPPKNKQDGPPYQQPRGRPPKGKVWNAQRGLWVTEGGGNPISKSYVSKQG